MLSVPDKSKFVLVKLMLWQLWGHVTNNIQIKRGLLEAALLADLKQESEI